jgi:lysozyme
MQAEGFRQFPYFDCCGKPFRQCACARQGILTIGFGRNLESVGLSKLEAEVLLDHDLYTAESQATKAFEWFGGMKELRQRAITELVFNMGMKTFLGFRQTILACKVGQWSAAAANLLESKWKAQVGPARSERIARYLRDGD